MEERCRSAGLHANTLLLYKAWLCNENLEVSLSVSGLEGVEALARNEHPRRQPASDSFGHDLLPFCVSCMHGLFVRSKNVFSDDGRR